MGDMQLISEVKEKYDKLSAEYADSIKEIESENTFNVLLEKYKGNYDYKFFQIKNNNFYLITPQIYKMEPRLEAVKCHYLNLLKKYKLPDMEFMYFDGDVLNTNEPIIVSTSCIYLNKQILAPDFMFQFSPNVNLFNYKKDTESIISEAKNNGIDFDTWKNKNNKIFYRGSANNYYRRKYLNLDKNISDIKNVNSFVAPIGHPNYDPHQTKDACTREFKTKFKYLLHLNGHEDSAYSSAFRFNLACCSLVFYATQNFCKEWWFHEDIFKNEKHFIHVSTPQELKQAYKYFENNQEKAFEIANNGYNFFKTYLNSESVEYFYYKLLLEYSKKLKYNINPRQDAKLITSYEKYNENSK
jgi:hypothetical protein